MHSIYSKKCSWLRGTVSQAGDTRLTPGQVLLSNGPTRVQMDPGLQGEDELGPLSPDSTEVRMVTFKGVSTSLFHALFRKALFRMCHITVQPPKFLPQVCLPVHIQSSHHNSKHYFVQFCLRLVNRQESTSSE